MTRFVWAAVLFLMASGLASFADTALDGYLEKDWLIQEKVRYSSMDSEVTPETDAAGACDGVKDGKWGFHTDLQDNPWWQVDLGAIHPVGCVVLWNRCDGVADRMGRVTVSLSDDGNEWRDVYTHDGPVFYGFSDGKPLVVDLTGRQARFVRLSIPGNSYFHLDEVEVFSSGENSKNLALRKPAVQSSISPWSTDHRAPGPLEFAARAKRVLANCRLLLGEMRDAGDAMKSEMATIDEIEASLAGVSREKRARDLFLKACRVQRRLTLALAPLDFDAILFAKRVPGSFNHMSDQYYGWWSRPGGGLYILEDLRGDAPTTRCISDAFTEPGSFLRPELSSDATKVLFAWCRHYPGLQDEPNKLDKNNVPEDAFYHLFEMNLDGTGVRQLTRGKYDDFDGRYLPDGRIVFLSTRRGQALEVGAESAAVSLERPDAPDCYVRCGGGPERPVAVYTLHTINADGSGLCAISPFEMFEWTPSITADGTILYSRWDYIDRHNMPYMSLWSTNPDGTNARLVYGNFTHAPHCTFEPRRIPGSRKIIFTASGHHAQTMGSLVLLDPTVGTEGDGPVKRLTPEVCFPEIEGWPTSFYANPWPLSERFYLVAWGTENRPGQGSLMAPDAFGLYLFDAETGVLELLHRDPAISSRTPIPLRPVPAPPVLPSLVKPDGPREGRLLLADVYRGLKTTKRGDIKALRIVAVPAKTHPTMNAPSLGIIGDDPGKCVLGTVPVEADGSAHFRLPAGVIVFLQALDDRGMAVQTMRSSTHVQPGQTLSCVGCHESRMSAPALKPVEAARREPSPITVGPEGSWPLRFDQLVQPVLDKHCVRCHNPQGENPDFDLTTQKAYDSLCASGSPSLAEHVRARYNEGRSLEGACAAATSPVLARLTDPKGHHGVRLDPDSLDRLIVWMDTSAQRLGGFSPEQEQDIAALSERHPGLFLERPTRTAMIAGEAMP